MRMRERKLDESEYGDMLRQNIIGTLSLCEGQSPYAVQVEYLYQGGAIYIITFHEGRKIECLKQNNRAVFTVFEDRHSHPDMLKQKIRCRSVMAEGTVETIYIKEVTNHKGAVLPFRLLRFNIEKTGSWQCDRKRCGFAAGIDNRDIVREWLKEAAQAGDITSDN
jgi:pyridoxamine 5'-phosphate oxidase-like protein